MPSPSVLIIGREALSSGPLPTPAGLSVACVETLAAAVPRLEATRPGLVVLDAAVLEAEETRVRQVFASRAGSPRIPVVLLASRDAPVELIEAGWRAGLDDCIFRPITAAQLAERLDAVGHEPAVLGAHAARRAPRTIVLSGDDHGLRPRLADLLEHSGYHVLDVGGEPPAALPTEGRVNLMVVAGTELARASTELARVGALLGPLGEKDVPRALIVPGGAPAGAPAQGPAVLDRANHIEALVGRIDRLVDRGPYDLRANARVPFFCPVEFREGGSSAPPPWRSGYAFNISSGGVFVRTLVPPRAGVALEMKLRVTTTREEFPVTGVVAWANRYQGRSVYSYPVGMGVQFLGPPISKRLATLIELCREQVSAA